MFGNYPLTYVLCFLTCDNQVLMLHRKYPPNQGFWNGVGGRIEPEESPLEACLREVNEETGYQIASADYAGILTWSGYEISDGGLHIFHAKAPMLEPVENDEGILAWKNLDWILASGQAVDNIPYFILNVLRGDPPQHYHFNYHSGRLIDWTKHPL